MSDNKVPGMPEVKFNKNGYEIRTDILGMATAIVNEEYHAKLQGWELTQARDKETGQLVTTVTMPEYPGLDKILATAQKMYDFVNQSRTPK